MTRDEILALKPGPEMDVLVMEIRNPWDESRCRICGWPLEDSWKDGCVVDNCSLRPVPKRRADTPAPVSTDIAVAWPLFEEMVQQNPNILIHRYRGWEVGEDVPGDIRGIANGETAPEAITKAWLLWKEVPNVHGSDNR